MLSKRYKDITGEKFGKLTAIKFTKRKDRRTFWEFKCDCGNYVTKRTDSVISFSRSNCGCDTSRLLSVSNTTHGLGRTQFYKCWKAMEARCNNPKQIYYESYGGRGIKIKWKSFEEFKIDMYDSYLKHSKTHGKDTTIERVNVNGNYYKENCKWATHKEQGRNRRNGFYTQYRGKKVLVIELSEKFRINYQTLRARIKRGWNIKKCLSQNPNSKV